MYKYNKEIVLVSFNYFEDQFLKSIKKPCCLPIEISEFLFNWSLETVRQFGTNILNTIPSKSYISKASELENLNQLDKSEKILRLFDVFNLEKVDKLELICIFPFIVEKHFDNAFYCSIEFFSYENIEMISKAECYLFIDTLFRSIHKIILLEICEELSNRISKRLVRVHDDSLNEILNQIFENNKDELNHIDLLRYT